MNVNDVASSSRFYTAETVQSRVQTGTLASAELNNKILEQPGYATGDKFDILATLVANPSMRVLLTKGPDRGEGPQPAQGYDPRDRALEMQDFYRQALQRVSGSLVPSDARVEVVEVSSLASPASDDKATVASKVRDMLGADAPSSNRALKNMKIPVGSGTTFVSEKWTADHQTAYRVAMGVANSDGSPNTDVDPAIGTWLESKGYTPKKDDKVLVLWSRFSGKKGDIHVEHDTAYRGVRETIAMAKALGYDAVLIAGDGSASAKSRGKYDAISRFHTTETTKVVNLTEFWKPEKDDTALKAWRGSDRDQQMKLYDFLDRKAGPGNVKHLGSRSGNLQGLSMLGYSVRYLEEAGRGARFDGAERTQKLHEVPGTGKTRAGGEATGYERIQIAQPQTRSGRYYAQLRDEAVRAEVADKAPGQTEAYIDENLKTFKPNYEKRPDWVPAKRASNQTEKPPEISGIPKGEPVFSDEDSEKIKAYLKS